MNLTPVSAALMNALVDLVNQEIDPLSVAMSFDEGHWQFALLNEEQCWAYDEIFQDIAGGRDTDILPVGVLEVLDEMDGRYGDGAPAAYDLRMNERWLVADAEDAPYWLRSIAGAHGVLMHQFITTAGAPVGVMLNTVRGWVSK